MHSQQSAVKWCCEAYGLAAVYLPPLTFFSLPSPLPIPSPSPLPHPCPRLQAVWFRSGVIPPAGQGKYWIDPYSLFFIEAVAMNFAELRRWQVGAGGWLGGWWAECRSAEC